MNGLFIADEFTSAHPKTASFKIRNPKSTRANVQHQPTYTLAIAANATDVAAVRVSTPNFT